MWPPKLLNLAHQPLGASRSLAHFHMYEGTMAAAWSLLHHVTGNHWDRGTSLYLTSLVHGTEWIVGLQLQFLHASQNYFAPHTRLVGDMAPLSQSQPSAWCRTDRATATAPPHIQQHTMLWDAAWSLHSSREWQAALKTLEKFCFEGHMLLTLNIE